MPFVYFDVPATGAQHHLVSVIIPCHNQAAFLAEAIGSALQQTHQPVEVVVVDDGSTDDTARVAGAHPVQLLKQPKQGVCAAVNTGIKASHGQFVMRLDADDILLPSYVAETLAALEEQPSAQFAYTEVSYFGALHGTYPVEEFDPNSLAERNYIHASALMRRAAFECVGGYDERLATARCEDWDLWLGFAERDLPGVLVRKPLLRYRRYATKSRNTLDWRSLSLWRRNLALAGRLQENHPRLFAPRAITRRVARLPRRVLSGEVSPRFAVLLVGLYAAMLLHLAVSIASYRRPA
jgi:glycosyltransferase involved in cell wall biosynthesis